jgi:CheY-like chemotaxis protein
MRRREALEQELVRAQKLESLGVLAGGIAHDFNNLLMSVLGNISMAKKRLGSNTGATKILEQAEKACDRTRDLTRQLQLLTKGGAPAQRQAISPAAIIEETIRFVMMGSSSICKLDLPEDLWHIEGDPGQIARVFHNVVLNAQESMGSGGVIEIQGSNIVDDRDGRIPLVPGRYVRITIADQGAGIPAEELQRVFDPYYTSKEKGSGLGLALTYSIVKRHGGFVSIDSELGKGTTISIYLPVGSAMAAVEQPQPAIAGPGRGSVLVMDDDELVRSVASGMLSDLGYEVQVAVDGEDAVSRYRKASTEGQPFDVVILDLTVRGGMGGLEAIRALLEFDPQVRAVVSSGYSNDMVIEKYADHGFKSVLPKPYRMDEMGSVLGRILSAQMPLK